MSDKLTPEEIAAFCDAVQSVADFYKNGGREPWPDDRLSSWVLVEKMLPKFRAMTEREWVPVSERLPERCQRRRCPVTAENKWEALRSSLAEGIAIREERGLGVDDDFLLALYAVRSEMNRLDAKEKADEQPGATD